MPRLFLILSLFIKIFSPKILIFLVIYTDFVSDHSGRSDMATFLFQREELLSDLNSSLYNFVFLVIFRSIVKVGTINISIHFDSEIT